jgi:hypothetical protein
MSKKIYGALVPILAVVAFASISGVAQAAPHWYVCKHEAAKTHKWTDSSCSVENAKTEGEYERVRLPFNEEKTRVKTFGKLTLEASNGATITCFVDDHGKIWNTILANPGLDEIQVFENYECTSNFCEEGLASTAEGLPWPTELVAGPPIRDKIGSAAKPVKIRLTCTKPATNLLFEGTLEPEFVNGTQANGGTSFTSFSKTAGLKSGTITATVTGRDYVIGVENAEQILVFNP